MIDNERNRQNANAGDKTQQVEQVQNVLAQKRADGHNFGGNVNRYEATTGEWRANDNMIY